MANLNCEACEELRALDASFIVNGIQDDECASLKNDTGLVPSSGHDNCEDLETMNECLIGNMEATIDMADSCDWRGFVKPLIGNIHEMYKAMLCSMCGIWTNIHKLWEYTKSYRLSGSGHTVTLTAIDGSHGSYTVPDNDTTYTLTQDGDQITLHGSDGREYSVDVGGGGGGGSDTDSKYQLHTKTYESGTLTLEADSAATFDVTVLQPSQFSDDLFPMAVAGWTIDGTGVVRIATRYIQLIERASDAPKVRAVFYNGGSSTATFVFKPEVLWWGEDTQS